MKHAAIYILVCLLSVAGGGAAAYLAIDPVSKADRAQKAILAEYLATYCHPDQDHLEAFIAQAAALSRVMVKAELGDVALAEYAKCRTITPLPPYERKRRAVP